MYVQHKKLRKEAGRMNKVEYVNPRAWTPADVEAIKVFIKARKRDELAYVAIKDNV